MLIDMRVAAWAVKVHNRLRNQTQSEYREHRDRQTSRVGRFGFVGCRLPKGQLILMPIRMLGANWRPPFSTALSLRRQDCCTSKRLLASQRQRRSGSNSQCGPGSMFEVSAPGHAPCVPAIPHRPAV